MHRGNLYVARLSAWFECLGSQEFATKVAQHHRPDERFIRETVMNLPEVEVLAACSFHGDIGQAKKGLDAHATAEQAKVFQDEESLRETLRSEGEAHKEKYGIKFMVSAKGRTGKELLQVLRDRQKNTRDEEWNCAREALFEICWKRSTEHLLLSRHIAVGSRL